ncbi:hypothetical protein JCGZ_22152 [Jatropha curcas]|uniref:Uncharacterized protein n=1 Tax=Jatropha curcas TaxID=180498 RepID=A0A067LIV2_JATCU|nr:acetylajmalan esterase [Jatropha curcas]KDP44570.1 hypothetical protein JCGZ_22152 [Jatropha curcas]
MGSFKIDFPYVISVFIFINLYSCYAQDLKACKFDQIYQFGDSQSDPGNSIIEIPQAYHARPPYGITINKATGRSNDGKLMIDYIAESAGLPWIEPYENPNSTLVHGANFAVAGVTALRVEDLIKWKIPLPYTNSSLLVQLEWFDKLMAKTCQTNCKDKLKSALFVVGTIGANDYDFAAYEGRGVGEIKDVMVPGVMKNIKQVIEEIIRYGAVRIVAPGVFQLGCTPSLLTLFETNKTALYDSLGCLKDYNDLFIYHNTLLQEMLKELQQKYPDVTILYGDIYSALQWILEDLTKLGFKSFKQGCCGTGGKYNFTPGLKHMCGAPGVPVCPNPREYVFWDGGHFSDQANKYLAEWLLKDLVPKLKCSP